MKEKDFVKRYPKRNRKIEVPFYYGFDDKGNVLLDEEEMERDFNNKLQDIMELLNQDELQQIITEKIRKIKK